MKTAVVKIRGLSITSAVHSDANPAGLKPIEMNMASNPHNLGLLCQSRLQKAGYSALKFVAGFLLIAITIISMPSLVAAQTGQESEKPTLYKRLGGYDVIAGFVDLAFPATNTPRLSQAEVGIHQRDRS